MVSAHDPVTGMLSKPLICWPEKGKQLYPGPRRNGNTTIPLFGESSVLVRLESEWFYGFLIFMILPVNGVVSGRAEKSKKRDARRDAAMQALACFQLSEEDEVELMITASDEE